MTYAPTAETLAFINLLVTAALFLKVAAVERALIRTADIEYRGSPALEMIRGWA